MKIGDIYNSSGEHIGTVESEGGGRAPNPVILFIVEAIAFCGFGYLFWVAFLKTHIMDVMPIFRLSVLTDSNDMTAQSGLNWLIDLWSDGSFSGKVEVILWIITTISPIIVGFFIGLFVGKNRVSKVIGIVVGVIILLIANIPCAALNCLVDRGIFHFMSMYSTYYFSSLLNIMALLVPVVALLICMSALSGVWELIAWIFTF